MLLDAYGVDMEISSDDNSSRMIVLNTASPDGISPMAFEEVSTTYNINKICDTYIIVGVTSLRSGEQCNIMQTELLYYQPYGTVQTCFSLYIESSSYIL